MLTPRERFLTALTGGVPDRVPIFDFLFDQALYQHVIGRKPEDYNCEDAIELSLALGLDAVYLPTGAPRGYQRQWIDADTYATEWGTTRQRNPASWPIDAPIAFPIQTRADWDNFQPPDPWAAGRMDPIEDGLRLADGRLAVLGSVGGPFTPSWEQTGIDVFSMLIYDDPELVRAILRAHTDFSIAIARQLVAAGVDAVLISDDFGWNGGTLVSPPHFREFILPLFVELVSTVRSLGKPVLLHSCGNVNEILDEIGRAHV